MDLLFKQLPRALWQASAWRDLTVQADLRYDAPAACTLDALRPTDRDEVLPVVLHIHGGAFRVLSKETHGYVASRYARAGFLVLNVEFRLAPESPFPAAVRDVHAAWLWARDHVAELGGGPDRILLSGESAGANLALGLALSTTIDRDEPWARAVREAGARPLGVHACYGFLQATDTARYGRDLPVGALVGARLPIIERDYLARADATWGLDYADPVRIIEQLDDVGRLPPVLAVCGTRDPISDDTARLIAALRGRADLEALWVKGAGHGFHCLPGRRSEEAWLALLGHAERVVGPR